MGKKAQETVGVLTSTGLICDIPRTGVWVGRFTGAPAEIRQLLGPTRRQGSLLVSPK
jgi:hypothetical protein